MVPQSPVSPGLQSAYKALYAAQSSPPTPHEATLLAIITVLMKELYTLQQQVSTQTERIDALGLERYIAPWQHVRPG